MLFSFISNYSRNTSYLPLLGKRRESLCRGRNASVIRTQDNLVILRNDILWQGGH